MKFTLAENDHLGTGELYNQQISKVAPTGKILAVGDSAREHAILNMPYFHENRKKIQSVGINLSKQQCGTYNHFTILYGNAHELQYSDEYFDCVVSIMMLEHDPEFWLSLAEMKRVLRPGGSLIIAIPGFIGGAADPSNWGQPRYPNLPKASTLCYELHGNPDCYRFSPHWYERVVFKDFQDVSVVYAKLPPRLIGSGYKRQE